MHLSRRQLASIVAGVAVLSWALPVAAETVVDFARNAGHVDGISAVHAGSSVSGRSGKLVATGNKGYLPNNIVKKAPLARDAQRLSGRTASAFAQQCGDGAVLGRSVVPSDVSSTYQDVPGFATSVGGPPSKDGSSCHVTRARAEHLGTGVYRVRLGGILEQGAACSVDLPAGDAGVVITPRSDTGAPLVATYRPTCDDALSNNVVDEVRITTSAGTPTDATFAIELINLGGVPAP